MSTPNHFQPCPSLGHLLLDVCFLLLLVTPSSVSLFGSYLSSVLPTDPQKVLFVHTETFSALPFFRASVVRRDVFYFMLVLVMPSSLSLFASYLSRALPTDPQKVLFVHTETFSALPFLRASVVRRFFFSNLFWLRRLRFHSSHLIFQASCLQIHRRSYFSTPTPFHPCPSLGHLLCVLLILFWFLLLRFHSCHLSFHATFLPTCSMTHFLLH